MHDFLFTYYNFKPAQLRRWHPGYGVALENAAEYAAFSGYRVDESGTATVEASVLERRRHTVEFVWNLLNQTSARPAVLGCFGLHEWAMVYRAREVFSEICGFLILLDLRGQYAVGGQVGGQQHQWQYAEPDQASEKRCKRDPWRRGSGHRMAPETDRAAAGRRLCEGRFPRAHPPSSA